MRMVQLEAPNMKNKPSKSASSILFPNLSCFFPNFFVVFPYRFPLKKLLQSAWGTPAAGFVRFDRALPQSPQLIHVCPSNATWSLQPRGSEEHRTLDGTVYHQSIHHDLWRWHWCYVAMGSVGGSNCWFNGSCACSHELKAVVLLHLFNHSL